MSRRAKTTAASNSGSFATQARGEAEGVSLALDQGAVADRIMRHFGYDGMPAEVDYEDPRIDYSLPQHEIDATIDSLSPTSEQWRDIETSPRLKPGDS